VEVTSQGVEDKFAVTNAILFFFSELNSVFLLQTLGPTLAQLLQRSRDEVQLQQLWGFNGMKVR